MTGPSRYELLVETARMRLELAALRAELELLRARDRFAVSRAYRERLVERDAELRAAAGRCDRIVAKAMNAANAANAARDAQPFGSEPAQRYVPQRVTTFAERKVW